ncbi:MAG: mobile mystery protein A [Actinobacteria bacterium]|jgi:predicted DNA-binding mobile mystery protein A|nr:mobile mystery protein A [Actinomycetota bacterium]
MNQKKSQARQHLDDQLRLLRGSGALAKPPRGWIRAYRDALGMTADQLGARMGISRAAASQLEASETEGSINLASLQRAAEAMEATVQYVFIPNTSLEDTVRRRAEEIAGKDLQSVEHTMRLEDQGVGEEVTKRQLQDQIAAVIDSRRLWATDR